MDVFDYLNVKIGLIVIFNVPINCIFYNMIYFLDDITPIFMYRHCFLFVMICISWCHLCDFLNKSIFCLFARYDGYAFAN